MKISVTWLTRRTKYRFPENYPSIPHKTIEIKQRDYFLVCLAKSKRKYCFKDGLLNHIPW